MKKGFILFLCLVFFGISYFIYVNYIEKAPIGVYKGTVTEKSNCSRTFTVIKLDAYPEKKFSVSGVNNNLIDELQIFCNVVSVNDSVTINFDSNKIYLNKCEELYWDLVSLSRVY